MLEIDDDIAFDKLYADKREKEMVFLLRQVVSELKKENGTDEKVSDAIEKNNASLQIFIQKLQLFQKQDPPEIKIENNNEEIESIGNQIIENQKILIEILEKKPIKLKVNRENINGDPLICSLEIEYGLVTYKNSITYKK